MRLFSPAKVNLFLRVLKKREDGFHELASLFQAVDLGDTLTFSLSDHDKLLCNDPTIPLDASNLIWKATSLFKKKTGYKFGLNVSLEKKIPMQAGIGGGSSNAATTLYALNELFGKKVSEEELKTWAGEIGSDISFFFSLGRAFCTGRGEIVQNIASKKESLWLVKPPQGLSTPLIYQLLDLNRCSSVHPLTLLEKNEKTIYFLNDLEEPAFHALPQLKEIKEELLKQGYTKVSLTGSGTGIMCVGEKRPHLPETLVCYHLNFISRDQNSWYS